LPYGAPSSVYPSKIQDGFATAGSFSAILVLLTPQSVTKPLEIAEILCTCLPKTKP
jgi:hypothetical protein